MLYINAKIQYHSINKTHRVAHIEILIVFVHTLHVIDYVN